MNACSIRIRYSGIWIEEMTRSAVRNALQREQGQKKEKQIIIWSQAWTISGIQAHLQRQRCSCFHRTERYQDIWGTQHLADLAGRGHKRNLKERKGWSEWWRKNLPHRFSWPSNTSCLRFSSQRPALLNDSTIKPDCNFPKHLNMPKILLG